MEQFKPGEKISTISMSSIIEVPISGAFYSRIQQCTFALLEQKMKDDPDGSETNKLLKELESREPKDLWELQLTINLALLFATEEAAGKQNLILKQDPNLFLPKDSQSEASPES
jgi:hypothetical protein